MPNIIDFTTRQVTDAPEFWRTRGMLESAPSDADTYSNIAIANLTAFEEAGQLRWSIDGIVPFEVARQIIDLCCQHNAKAALTN